MRKIISKNAEAVTIGSQMPNPGTLFIGTGGDLICTLVGMADGTTITFKNIADGSDFPRVVKFVDAASSCSDINVDIA